MSLLVATAAGGLPPNFPMAAAAGAGGDDGERRPPVGPMGKQRRSTHEEDNPVATGYIPWGGVAYACESCRLTFRTMPELLVHLAPSPQRCNLLGYGYYMFLVVLGQTREIYVVDDGDTTTPPQPLPGRVYHVPSMNFNPVVAMRAIRRYARSGHSFL